MSTNLTATQIQKALFANLIAGFFTLVYAGGVRRRMVIRHSDKKFFKFMAPQTLLFGYALSTEYRDDIEADEKRFKYCGRIVGNNVVFFQKFQNELIAEIGAEKAQAKMNALVNALFIINDTWDVEAPPQDRAYAVKNNTCVRCGRPLTKPETIKSFFGYGEKCFNTVMGR